jgi:Lung seven transmembrane receptor
MWRCRILAISHFIFAIAFAIGAMLITPESASPWVLLVVVPLTATTTTFYVWIITSLNATIRDLAERKQNVKMTMYKRVWGLLLWSVLVLFSFFFLNVVAFAQSTAEDFAPENWKSRWYTPFLPAAERIGSSWMVG